MQIDENENKSYYHIYFDDKKEEINRFYVNASDKVKKIKIAINNEVKSLHAFFFNCKCIKKIDFIKFKRNDINNFNNLFNCCTSLEEINLSNVITDNVTNMGRMFRFCSSLKELDLSHFNTDNVTDMSKCLIIVHH